MSSLQSKKIDIENDALLLKLKNSLSGEFIMRAKEDSVYIEKKDSVWVLFENKINAPVDRKTQEERIRDIKKHGIKTMAQLVFRCENKWDKTKLAAVTNHDDSINNIIGILPGKYNISKLDHKFDDYIANTPADEKNLESYREEKGLLESKLIIIPDYQSKKYAMFLCKEIGVDDEFHTVYPFETTGKIYDIKNLLSKIMPLK